MNELCFYRMGQIDQNLWESPGKPAQENFDNCQDEFNLEDRKHKKDKQENERQNQFCARDIFSSPRWLGEIPLGFLVKETMKYLRRPCCPKA